MVDIIIPVYNTPLKDLERCFDSVVNQTFKNYNVYIIDDGSDEIIKEYIKENNFIISIIQKFFIYYFIYIDINYRFIFIIINI